MQPIDNVLAIPEDSGYLIGKPVQAFLGRNDLKIKSFLCQLFGLPARIIYCNADENLVQVDDSSIRLASFCRPTLVETGEELAIANSMELVPLIGIPLLTKRDGFVGFLKDFELNPEDLSLEEVRTDDERWRLIGNVNLETLRGKMVLVVDEVRSDILRSNHYFFDKKVIQDVSPISKDTRYKVGSYCLYGEINVQR